MKIISLSILSIALSISLSARDNPFEPTDHFLAQKEMIIKINHEKKIQQELAEKKLAEKKIKASKVESKEIIKLQNETTKIAKKEIVNKPYIPEVKETFTVLPFVNITIVNDVLTLTVDKKYKLLNQDILKPAKKLLFDFEGDVSFYTIRKPIISEDYKSFAVGTHREEKFFRVVIDLPSEITDYREEVDSKNGIITITRKSNSL
ncbi:MAG: hypothetical protein WA945_03755, partial [Arcobacteraceae bacterium]